MPMSKLARFSACLATLFALTHCNNNETPTVPNGSGGSNPAGGSSAQGGSNATGGANATGGNSTGGTTGTTGGANSTGGATSPTGGTATGGTGTGGKGAGGTAAGGTSPTGGTTGTAGATGCAGNSSFTETANGVAFDMVCVPGGTFTIGCESSTCPADTAPVSGVKVSRYAIGKTEVTTGLWNAVMGGSSSGGGTTSSITSITWYNAMEFACKLSQMTGRKYRMTTEAEWEYAAKNHLNSLEKIGSGEEWAYNSWSSTHMGGTDPVGPSSGQHTQKTRRDAQGTIDNITGRLIRSIDGIGPALRLAVSAEMDFPPNYVPPCDLHAPVIGAEPENSYRDPRWITGSDAHWTTGSIAVGSFDLRVWDDGTARLGSTNGQWFTSNNIAFVFVPSSGSSIKFPYIFLDATQGSLISETSFMSGGYVGRILKESASNYAKPTISGLKSGAELAAAAGANYRMVDMVNIPDSAKQQDSRLLDGPDQCWFQDNTSAGGLHHYRKDVDPDEFRFTVNQGQAVMLANGKWFTVNNTFLRITHSPGYTTDYLYAVTSDGYFFHDSFQAYERADFRMFQKKANSSTFPASCGSQCSSEIPKGQAASLYASLANGNSTFVPAPCPTNGCQ
jgi:formylglycine-generating enzyme required for sulfatase activity